jgi:hypothetical protein
VQSHAPGAYERSASHKFLRCVTFLKPSSVPNAPGRREGLGIVTETTKRVLPSVIARVLPLSGLCAAIIVNAAWIGFLGYWIFRLVI